MTIHKLFFIAFVLFSFPLFAQVGGTSTYQFLTLTNAARVAALGGNVISIKEKPGQTNDLNFVFHNPALLDSTMNKQLVMNYINYFADVKYGYVGYAKQYGKIGTFALGMHYVNYGDFIKADEEGNKEGTFTAAEYALNAYWSKPLDTNFTIGANFKQIYSNLYLYHSYGVAMDLGATYTDNKNLYTAALVLKNIGTQIVPYTTGNYEPLPFDIQMAITKRLAHAPLRLSLLAHHLYKWDMTYKNPIVKVELDGDTTSTNKTGLAKIGDNILRHINLGAEVLFSEHFHVDFGYNFQRSKELSIEDKQGAVGFSWGFGIKLTKFNLSYGRACYHLAGASNHFSLGINLAEFYKK